MKTISDINCGIKSLQEVLNRVVKAINARTISPGAGITISETAAGVVIAAVGSDDQGQPNTGGGPAGAWRTITIASQDDNGQTQLQDMLVWSQPPGDPYPCE